MGLEDYHLIPITEIEKDAKDLSELWSENMKDNLHEHRLASDIMNYAVEYHLKESKKLLKQIEYLRKSNEYLEERLVDLQNFTSPTSSTEEVNIQM